MPIFNLKAKSKSITNSCMTNHLNAQASKEQANSELYMIMSKANFNL